ncbi:hypothetical protein GLP37_20510 [Photobacterium phosphoreum]|uniref:hypothetical protein n=1 Tax=Photobacterium phosphoreum TaxID=659 RepID=UPI001E60CEA0|nr:hypothetical protein [Photobacterium phosphoreum]MCD9504549.1 hypothetical protein [Photobacterium phosphoreum]
MSDGNVIEFNFSADPKRVFDDIKKTPKYSECQHTRMSLDHSTDTVSCNDCGKSLSPMWVLSRIAEKHSKLYWDYSDLYKKANKAAQMNKCKCQNCGKVTKIVKE